jgi:hypothetical protein
MNKSNNSPVEVSFLPPTTTTNATTTPLCYYFTNYDQWIEEKPLICLRFDVFDFPNLFFL